MNVHVLHKVNRFSNFIPKLRTVRNVHLTSKTSNTELLIKQEPQLTQSSVGINVISIEDYKPLSLVAVAIKAGSRYETPNNLGVTHCLRNAACLSTQKHSSFTLTRELELQGAKLDVTATREHLIYSFTCPRDHIDSGIEILSEIINHCAFKPWEVQDSVPRMQYDLSLQNCNPEAVLIEALHKASFKGGLNNSLYSPQFMIGKHDPEMLMSYVSETFTSSRTNVIGFGIPHDQLQESVNTLFSLPDHVLQSDTPSKFVAREVRHETNIPFVHAAIVAEGASVGNNVDLLSLGVLQSIFGSENSPNNKFSKLGEAVAKKTSNPFHVSSLNINYSDSGLFGVYICAHPNEMNEITKAVVSEMKNIAKSITESDVLVAKQKLKTKLLLEKETTKSSLISMLPEISQFKHVKSTAAVEKAIDDLKISDITSIASKVFKAKPAMAAVGRLHATPHIDELV